MNILEISRISSDKSLAYDFLCRNGILKSGFVCSLCDQKPMSFVLKAQLSDGHIWQCSKCHQQISIRADSIFSGDKISLGNGLLMLYCFSVDIPPYLTARMMQNLVEYRTILNWYEKFRALCSKAMISDYVVFDDEVEVGQMASAVEIDECWMGKKAKNERGTGQQNNLVFGIVERKGTKCVLYVVPNAKKETLIPIIKRHIAPTTKIYHDGLATYSALHEHGYSHDVVFHNKEFVTKKGVHTNTIEGLWGNFRQRAAIMHGIKNTSRLAAHLDEFSFRQNYKDSTGSIWAAWMEHLKKNPSWWCNK